MDPVSTEDILYNNTSCKSSSSGDLDNGMVHNQLEHLTLQQRRQSQQQQQQQQQPNIMNSADFLKYNSTTSPQFPNIATGGSELNNVYLLQRNVNNNDNIQQQYSIQQQQVQQQPVQQQPVAHQQMSQQQMVHQQIAQQQLAQQQIVQQQMAQHQEQERRQSHVNANLQAYQVSDMQFKHHYQDKTIQKQLSPFYQPFGIDVSHFPLTNPPIFQNLIFDDDNAFPAFSTDTDENHSSTTSSSTKGSKNDRMNGFSPSSASSTAKRMSLTETKNKKSPSEALMMKSTPQDTVKNQEQNVKSNTELFREQQMHHERSRYPFRRRISISNGQIGQLNENTIMVDEVYYTQPPPLPPAYHQTHGQQQNVLFSSHTQEASDRMNSFSLKSDNNKNDTLMAQTDEMDPCGSIKVKTEEGTEYMPGFSSVKYESPLHDAIPHPMDTGVLDIKQETNNNFLGNNQTPLDSMRASVMAGISNDTQGFLLSNDDFLRDSKKKKTGAKRILPPSVEFIPGTDEWKKARLLERNRIAATRCRQRKKVQQEQFLKDFLDVKYENIELKRKVQNLENELDHLKQKLFNLVSESPSK